MLSGVIVFAGYAAGFGFYHGFHQPKEEQTPLERPELWLICMLVLVALIAKFGSSLFSAPSGISVQDVESELRPPGLATNRHCSRSYTSLNHPTSLLLPNPAPFPASSFYLPAHRRLFPSKASSARKKYFVASAPEFSAYPDWALAYHGSGTSLRAFAFEEIRPLSLCRSRNSFDPCLRLVTYIGRAEMKSSRSIRQFDSSGSGFLRASQDQRPPTPPVAHLWHLEYVILCLYDTLLTLHAVPMLERKYFDRLSVIVRSAVVLRPIYKCASVMHECLTYRSATLSRHYAMWWCQIIDSSATSHHRALIKGFQGEHIASSSLNNAVIAFHIVCFAIRFASPLT